MLDKYSKELKNSNEHLSNTVIATYINLKDNLSEKEISFVENHLSICEDCKKRLNEMMDEDLEIDEEGNSKITRLPVSAWPSQDGQNYKIRKSRYYGWAIAAMIIIAIGMGIYFYFLPQKQVIVKNNKSMTDSLSIKGNNQTKRESQEKIKNYNKEDFAANNILENFVNRNVRSESNIKIKSPGIGDTLSIPIDFKWGNGKGNYIFELVNNVNKLIAKRTLANNHFVYEKNLTPGLYYWKILIDNKLSVIGKFYILR